ncbi:Platinum sensitivity protein [Rhodotorula kratochvilovae]
MADADLPTPAPTSSCALAPQQPLEGAITLKTDASEPQGEPAHASAVSDEQPGPDEELRSRTPSPPSSRPTPAPDPLADALSEGAGRASALDGPVGELVSASLPSTPTRSSPQSNPTTVSPADLHPSLQQQQQPHTGSSPALAGAVDSSPTSARTQSSPSSTASQSPSGPPPSRRVKVYRLKDDAWIDLGTGTCSGVFVQAPVPEGEGADGDVRMALEDGEEEGAWIIVRRERVRRGGLDSPTGKKGKRREEGDSPTKGKELGSGSESPSKGERQLGADNDDDEYDEGELILRTRVQPYPPGYMPEDLLDEEEMTSVDDNGNMTVDAGGYQRQQDTLIVWTERADTEGDEEREMALSFATPSGCGEMWEFIKAARRFAAEQQGLLHSPSPSPSEALSSPQPVSMSASASLANSLPEPSLGNIPHLENAIRQMSRTAVGRERAASVIVRTGYIEKLCKVQEEAEDLESLEDLHALCRVMQSIFLLNDNAIFEHVLKDEVILGVVGILEYDPDFPTMRASYRQHLSSPTAFVPVVPPSLLPSSLLAKIHQTHRLHYLKDVVLARILEDSTFSMLNSAIYFNEVDIVNEIAGERELVREVFRILEEDPDAESAPLSAGSAKGKERDLALGPKRTIGPSLPADLAASPAKRPRLATPPPASTSTSAPADPSAPLDPAALTPQARKLHATLFLQQLSQMAKNLQLQVRTAFFKTLCDRGLLGALEGALRFAARAGARAEEEREDAIRMRQAALGVWMCVVDLDPLDVRAYCLRQGREVEKRAEEADALEEADAATALERELEEEEMSAQERERQKREKEEREARRTLLGLLIGTLKEEEDLGLKAQLAEALRVLVDVTGEGGPLSAPPRMRQEDPEAEKFLQYFYDHCILSLVQPLISLPQRNDTDPPLDLSAATIALLTHLCDLLCFFITHHTFRSKYLILSSPELAKSVSRILRPRPRLTRHTHLRLAALRFLRACVARNDDFYNRFLVKHDLVRPVLDTADEEKDKDNLLGSACLDFFEYLRTSNAKALLNHLMDRGGDIVRRLAKGSGATPPLRTFEALIARWEMNNEPPPLTLVSGSAGGEGATAGSGGGATSSSMQRQPSQPGWTPRRELEEESYFNTSDDEDDSAAPPATVPPETAALLASASFGSSRRKREPTSHPDGADSASPKRAKLDVKPLDFDKAPLVDYADDDDDEILEFATDAPAQPKEEQPAHDDDAGLPAGGFVRERRGALDVGAVAEAPKAENTSAEASPAPAPVKDAADPAVAVPDEKGAPPFLPSLGALKRKKEEDDDGELGLLAKRRSPFGDAPAASEGKPASSGSDAAPKPGGLSFSLKASSPSATSSASPPGTPAAPKPGGFKIALGGLKSKFTGGGAGAKQGDAKG